MKINGDTKREHSGSQKKIAGANGRVLTGIFPSPVDYEVYMRVNSLAEILEVHVCRS